MSPHLQTQKEVASLLTAWKHLEVLSPQTDNGKVYNYREIRNAPRAGGRDLKIGDPQWFRSGFELPWNTRSKPDDRRDKVCYQVVIGRIDYRRAVGKLLEVFQDRREEKPFGAPSYACQAVIVVDSRGMPFEDEKGKPALDTVAISVFAFAFDKVLNKNLQVLSKWRETERKAKEDLIRGLFAPAGESVGPLAFDAVERAAEWLADEFKIPRELRAKPNFLVKRQLSPYENRPSPDLINSFLLDELEHIRTELNSGAGGEAIRRYLRMNLPPDKVDLLCPDLAEVSKVLAPRKMPKARWPIPGGHSLVLLQQAAVNAAFDELKDPGLYSVNGPPGTGKTTLLKDIVAGVEFDRAQALVKFDNPETAFKGTGQLVITVLAVVQSAEDTYSRPRRLIPV